jgi:hypothetical protein
VPLPSPPQGQSKHFVLVSKITSIIVDLPEWMKCQIRLFADDTKLWKTISQTADSIELQADLDNLMGWSNIWQLKINAGKCKVMHVGHAWDTRYLMTEDGVSTQLENTNEERSRNYSIQ